MITTLMQPGVILSDGKEIFLQSRNWLFAFIFSSSDIEINLEDVQKVRLKNSEEFQKSFYLVMISRATIDVIRFGFRQI